MASKKTRTRLLVAGAAAAASALAFYLAWKAFRAFDDLHTDDEDPEKDDQSLSLPCSNYAEIRKLENLMKTTEEKRVSKIAEEEESGFKLEGFDQFIAEEYGEVLVDFGARDVFSGNGQGKLESSFTVSEIPVDGDFDGIGGYGIASGREEDTQKSIQFCCRSNEGSGDSEGFVGEISNLYRDVGFDEMSMQDMSEEDGIMLGNAHQASDSEREFGGQSAAYFEFDCGMSVESVQSYKEQNFENLGSTESLDSADMDCHGSVGQLLKEGILSSNGIVKKQSDCQREADVENSDGLISNEHVSLKSVESIEDGSLENPPIENNTTANKGLDKLLSDLSEDSKKSDVEVSQQPKFGNININHNGPEDSGPDSDGTRSKSSSGMDCDTLSSQVYEEVLNTSDIATNEHSGLQTGEDLGKQVNGETNLLQTNEETNKSRRAGNVKFEDQGSHLMSLPHMDHHDKSTLLEGSSASKLESTMNGGSNKHSEGLDAYDAYLADPSLSPSMRSQVTRAKAIAQKLYAAKEG